MALKISKLTPARVTPLVTAAMSAEEEARMAFLAERWSDAHQAYLRALEENPHSPDLYQEVGICLLKMGEHEKSLIALCRALRYDRKLVGSLNAVGIALYELGHFTLAETFFQRVLELAPEHPLARQSLLACRRNLQTQVEPPAALSDLVRLARPGRPTVSLCMIVKNEEAFLEGCLDSVQGAVDEIVIVDTGSTDRTLEIASRYGARILHHPWTGNFSEARNVGLDAATSDWTLVLDADERLADGQADQLRNLLENDASAGYSLTIDNLVGEEARKGRQVATVFRLFRNRPDVRFEGRIHEQVILSAQKTGLKTYPSTVHILHLGYTKTAMESRDKLNRNLDLLERQLAEEPENPYVHYNLGQTLKMMGKLDEARARFEEALRRLKANGADRGIPYYANLYFALSDTLRLLEDFEAARLLLEEGLAIYPDFPDLHFTLGSVHLDQEQFHEALTCYERCVALGDRVHAGGTDPAVTGYKGQTAIGICKARLGRSAEALRHLQAAEETNPLPDADLHTNIGILLSQQGDTAEAIQHFVQALELNPRELKAWVNLATLSYQLGRYAESAAAWDQALGISDDIANGRVMQAEALLRTGEFGRARTRLMEELSRNPESDLAWFNWGFLNLLIDDAVEATSAWTRLSTNPDARALVELGAVVFPEADRAVNLAELRSAARAWATAIDLLLLNGRHEHVQRLLTWLEGEARTDGYIHAAVAQILLGHGFHAEALQGFLAARTRLPQDAGIYVGLGETCLALDLKDDARVMFEQACALAPDAAHPRKRLTQLQA